MVRIVSLTQTALHAIWARKPAWSASLVAFTLAAGLAGTATANAWLRVAVFKPRDASAKVVEGKVDVQGDCRGYVSCRFHSSLERSSWRGWQTVDGSIVRQKYGVQYPDAWKLRGTYDYRSHFHADITQWGICAGSGRRQGSYACAKSGEVQKDSDKIRLRR
jgi:hypothetical protein